MGALFYEGAALERLGRLRQADRVLREAAEAGAGYPPPCRVSAAEFDRVVEATLAELPGRIKEVLDAHCVVLREDFPPAVRVRKDGVDPLLLGECVGSLEDTKSGLAGPIEVIVYRRNLEKVCGSLDELAEEVRKTVLHEVGHAMGLDEDGVAALGLA